MIKWLQRAIFPFFLVIEPQLAQAGNLPSWKSSGSQTPLQNDSPCWSWDTVMAKELSANSTRRGSLAKWDSTDTFISTCSSSFILFEHKQNVWRKTSHLGTTSVKTRYKITEKRAGKTLGTDGSRQHPYPQFDTTTLPVLWSERK